MKAKDTTDSLRESIKRIEDRVESNRHTTRDSEIRRTLAVEGIFAALSVGVRALILLVDKKEEECATSSTKT
jgi:hypothetical protein